MSLPDELLLSIVDHLLPADRDDPIARRAHIADMLALGITNKRLGGMADSMLLEMFPVEIGAAVTLRRRRSVNSNKSLRSRAAMLLSRAPCAT